MIRGTDATDRIVERPQAQKRWRLWVGAGLLVLVLAAALPAIARWSSAERSIDSAAVRTAVVVRGDLEREVAVEGRVVAAFAPSMFAPATGIVRLLVRPGDEIEVGDVVAEVESPELSSRLAQERSGLSAAEAELDRRRLETRQAALLAQQETSVREVRAAAARRELERAKRTFEEGVIGRSVYEQAQDDLAIAELELEHSLADSRLATERRELELRNQALAVERQRSVAGELERQVDELRVRSPVAGQVARLDTADRNAVDRGAALVTVVDLTALELAIRVPETFADEVAAGTPVSVRGLDGEILQAEIRSLAPEVTNGLVDGRVGFPDGLPAGLKQNQRLSARLLLDSRRDVLKVRRGPFLADGGGHVAFVIENGLAERRRIEVGATSVTEVEIRDGLEEGDEIVISSLQRFGDADTVALR